jgi:acetoin utilization deacetylase AcuC-like enzyme
MRIIVQDKAEGFCYINDCVLALLHLRKRYSRILYLDIDVQ